MNKTARLITLQEYDAIISAITLGNSFARPNERVALIIRIVSETGCRLIDALGIRREDCERRKDRYILYLNDKGYCLSHDSSALLNKVMVCNKIGRDDLICNISSRAVQRCLATACSYLGLAEDVCIRSFAKLYQVRCESETIYSKDEHRKLMAELHSSGVVPKRYNSFDILSGVYCIKCGQNGRIYIGESRNIIKRWHEHLQQLNNDKHPNAKMQSDYRKYGAGAFDFNVLLLCDNDGERKQIESLYISAMGTIQFGYNIAS